MNNHPILPTINDIIINDFESIIINNFDIYRFNEINIMLQEYDTLFALYYNPGQENRNELNNLVNLIKLQLDQMNFETIYEIIRITINDYRWNWNLRQTSENFIKMYIYWYLYDNIFSVKRDQLMNEWDTRIENNDNNNNNNDNN